MQKQTSVSFGQQPHGRHDRGRCRGRRDGIQVIAIKKESVQHGQALFLYAALAEGRYSALSRRCVGGLLYASELRAGERLLPAGYRPAQAWVRAGWPAGHGGGARGKEQPHPAERFVISSKALVRGRIRTSPMGKALFTGGG